MMDLPGFMSVLNSAGGLTLIGLIFYKFPQIMKALTTAHDKDWDRWQEETSANREYRQKASDAHKGTVDRLTDSFRSTFADLLLTFREEQAKERQQCWTMFTHMESTRKDETSRILEHHKIENDRLLASIHEAMRTWPERVNGAATTMEVGLKADK